MKNLLFISVEDLNDWIAPLGGHPDAVTPHFDRLAARAATFEAAYCAAPACSPSRSATLFSKWPWKSGLYNNDSQWFDHFPYGEQLSLIGQLKLNGLTTRGCGKIFHSLREEKTLDRDDWDEFRNARVPLASPISRTIKAGAMGRKADFGPDPRGEPLADDLNRDWIISQIRPCAQGQVWGLGLYRPHLPFVVPQRFFDMIPAQVSLPPGITGNRFDPTQDGVLERLPQPARTLVRDFSWTGRHLHEHGEYNDFVRAYLASVAYADDNLGQVLDHLEATGLWEDTLIVLWSDHGWQFGEKLAFRKFTLWERALRVPLFFAGGGIAPRRIADPVSLVDVAPTVLSLLGLPKAEHFDGQDLSATIREGAPPDRETAPSVWGVARQNRIKLAFSVRSKSHRYTSYWNGGEELFDHRIDPFEHDNLLRSADARLPDGLAGLKRDVQKIKAEAVPDVGPLATELPEAPAPAKDPQAAQAGSAPKGLFSFLRRKS